MRVIWIFATSLTLFAQSCKKDGDSKNKDDGGSGETGGTEAGTDATADADGPDANGEGGGETGGTDSLAIDTSVVLDVLPIATLTEYAEAEATRTEGGAFTAGTLSVSSGASLRGSSFALTGPADPIPVGKISAGAPTAMKIFVRKVILETADNKSSVIFEHATGKEIVIEDGKADLTALAADAAATDSSPGFKATPGEYARLVVIYNNEAEVKGCVTGDFAVDGDKEYCTKTGKSLYDDCTTGCERAQFEGAAEWSKMPLSKMGPEEETIQVTYETGETIVVADDAAVKVTLVIDMNRMLRFYNRSSAGQAPNPTFTDAHAYFFTTMFEHATFIFVGEPGRIYGYDMSFHGCRNNSAFNDSGDTCNGGDVRDVGAWMTIVTNKSGKPLSVTLMPNDDNALTISKGSIVGVATPFEAGTSDSKVVINYSLGDPIGKIKDFPSLLEADGVGEAVDGVTFEATHSQGDVYGFINITRKM